MVDQTTFIYSHHHARERWVLCPWNRTNKTTDCDGDSPYQRFLIRYCKLCVCLTQGETSNEKV